MIENQLCKIPNCNKPASGEPINHEGYRPHESKYCKEHTAEYKEMLERVWRAPIAPITGSLPKITGDNS